MKRSTTALMLGFFCEAGGCSRLLAIAKQSFVRSKSPAFSIVELQKASLETPADPRAQQITASL